MTHIVDKFSADLGCTVRDCLDCGCLTPGGPTRCKRCAKDADGDRRVPRYDEPAKEPDLRRSLEKVAETTQDWPEWKRKAGDAEPSIAIPAPAKEPGQVAFEAYWRGNMHWRPNDAYASLFAEVEQVVLSAAGVERLREDLQRETARVLEAEKALAEERKQNATAYARGLTHGSEDHEKALAEQKLLNEKAGQEGFARGCLLFKPRVAELEKERDEQKARAERAEARLAAIEEAARALVESLRVALDATQPKDSALDAAADRSPRNTVRVVVRRDIAGSTVSIDSPMSSEETLRLVTVALGVTAQRAGLCMTEIRDGQGFRLEFTELASKKDPGEEQSARVQDVAERHRELPEAIAKLGHQDDTMLDGTDGAHPG